MILVLGAPGEPMIAGVVETLQERRGPVQYISTSDMPGSVRFGFGLDGTGHFTLADGSRFDTSDVKAIYHRVGFYDFEGQGDYTAEETRYVTAECMAALNPWLNTTPGRVVNRPDASGTNASKPYQIALIRQFGFAVPETLVTNRPEEARAFYEERNGKVIYKSISYLRSIVQPMHETDLDRLGTIANCPVQLQERVVGTDVRVHVVGDRVFASLIEAEASDYRYDKKASIEAVELDDSLIEACIGLARGLDMSLAGIDLRVTEDGVAYCFEVNPSPAFTWYEARTSQPITAALCDWLQAA